MRAHFTLYTVAAAVLSLAGNASPARVLGLFPHTGRSHQMVFEPLLRTLAERGHHVTVVSFFPLKSRPENYTDVSLEGIAGLGVETIDLSIYESSNVLYKLLGIEEAISQIMDIHPLGDMALEVCAKLVSWPPLAEALRKEYDVVLVENFNSDCMLGLMHVYGKKVPTIGLLTSSLMQWTADRIGVTDNPAYVPVVSSYFTAPMTFLERMENTFISYYFKLWYRYKVQLKEQEIIERHFGKKIPDLNDLAKNTTMILANVFHSLTGARPLLPGLVEVGGMHIDPKRTGIPPTTAPLSPSVRGSEPSETVAAGSPASAMRAHFTLYTIAAAVLSLAGNASPARVLGLFPHTGRSHQMVFEPLLRTLAERGHHVTVVSFFPLKNRPENYTDISLEGIADLGVETTDLSIYESSNVLYKLLGIEEVILQMMDIHPLGDMALEVCAKLVSWPPLAEALRKEYDVVLVENFNSDCMLGLMHIYEKKVPTIGLLTSSLMQWTADRIGVNDNPAYVPVVSSDFTTPMTFLERLENTFLCYYFKLWYRYKVQLKEQEIIENHFGKTIPDLNDLAKNTTMMMANVFHSLTGPRPLLPGLVEVGGMHIDPKRTAIPPNEKL